MEQITVKPSGVVYIRGMSDPPSYIRRAAKKDICWTSYKWMKDIEKLKDFDPSFVQGSQSYDALLKRDSFIESLSKNGKTSRGYKLFDRILSLSLWDGQKVAAHAKALSKGFCLADPVGLGKTFSALAALIILRESNLIDHAVIVCTASVKHQWLVEITQAIREEERDRFTTVVIDGAKKARTEQYRQPAFIYVTGYESLRNDSSRGTKYPFFNTKQDRTAVVFDEAWKIGGNSILNRSMKKLFMHHPYKYALTASTVGSGYEKLFWIFNVVDPFVFISWGNFRDRYMRFKEIEVTSKKTKKKRLVNIPIGYRNIEDMKSKLRASLLRRTPEEMGHSLPKVTVTAYWVGLTVDQRKEYDRIKSKKSLNPVQKSVMLRVASMFTNKVPPSSSPKYKELLTILSEVIPEEKAIVFSESRRFLEGIHPELIKKGVKTEIITGSDSSLAREEKKQLFKGDTRILLLTAAGEAGMNLQDASVVINLDIPWNFDRLRQRVGRVRPFLGGSSRHVQVINILSEDTIEQRVVDVVRKRIMYFSRLFEESTTDLTGIEDVFEPKNLEQYS